MIVVLSGEGPSDLGQCNNAQGECRIPEFDIGPMTLLVDQIIEERLQYSVLEATPDRYVYLSERGLQDKEEERKKNKRSVAFAGKKREQETGYFYINAWIFGDEAVRIEQAANDQCVAVLFRDCDGTRSTAKGLWDKKLESMLNGFKRSRLGDRGVPMLPKPKSEAWLLCAAKADPYQHCAALESLPGNDDSPSSAKSQLDAALQGKSSTAEQVEWIRESGFDHAAVAGQIPSFAEFKDRLLAAVNLVI